ncbi:MFS transporter [Leifsonia shinshuensis]|uniref:MFS transporter n=1 Tax=Leifsonia shinshuensis TaxID=150026 RepID=A0A7G6Y803_9MICO|nr:MFS transporter [Leifsonia shinshuensis]QNE34618.1 MFS transporter [Leifsonia shinshuensis]
MSERLKHRTTRSLIVKVWVLTGTVAVADFIFGATFVTLMGQRGLGAALVGGLLSLTAVTALLIETPSGAWGDRFGHKRLVSCGLALWGAGLLVFSVASNPAVFAAAILLWSGGLALYSGASTALLVNTLNSEGLSHHGEHAIRGSETIRWASAALGAVLVALAGWAMADGVSIAISGGLLVTAAVWVTFTWPDSPRRSGSPIGRSMQRGVRYILSRKGRLLLALSVLAAIDLAIVILTWQPMTVDVVGFDAGLLGIVLLVLTLSTAAGAWTTRWTRRCSPEVVVGATLSIVNASLALVLLGAVGAIVAYVLAEFLIGIALTTLAVWAQATFPDSIRATATSLVGSATGVTMAITNGLMGQLWQALGLTSAVAWSAGVLVALLGSVGTLAAVTRSASRSANQGTT